MFLRLNFIVAVCMLSLKIRIASTSYPYPPYNSCGETSFTAASGVVRYFERSDIFRGCSYRIAVGQNNSVSIRFLSLNLQTTGGPCSRKWITLMCSLDQTKEAITKSSSEICHAGQWNSSLRVDDCPVLFVILHRPNSESTIDPDMPVIPDFPFSPYPLQSRTPPGWFQLRYEIQSTPTSSPINVTERPEIDCGQTLFRNRSGVIVLPRRTDVPLARINCTYTIEAAPRLTPLRAGVQRSISLNISHFDLLTLTDSLDACDQDRLRIECTNLGGERRTVWGCAQHFQPKYRDCVKLEMILRSDHYDPSPTRRIPYYRKPGDTADDIEEDEEEDDDADDRSNIGCGNTVFTASSGNVTSPVFPLSHPHSIHCIYRIKTEMDKVISLNIRNFNLEFSSGCSYDWLKISCALNEMNKTRKFCGVIQVTSALRYSNCSSIWLMFYADSSISRGGFKIEYSTSPRETSTTTDDEVVCGGTDFRANTGTVTLPSNPSGFMKTIDCTYNIYASDASFIFLDLTSINLTDIAYSIASCNVEHFMIACVNGTESWRFDLCLHRNHWSPQPSFSNCQQVQMRLYSKYFDFQTVHEIPYKIISTGEICGNTSFTASAGVISSPNFPQMYPSNVNCTYSISGTILSTISVRFPTFYMGDQRFALTSQGCKDWILMTCQSSNYVSPYAGRRFCGPLTWPPVVQFFNCSTLLLQFSSGPAVPGLDINRFSLNYTVSTSVRPSESIQVILPEIDCGDLHLTAESSRVQLPHNASLPLASLNCTFTASGSRKGLISINLHEHISDVSSSICSQDHITITCVSDKATAYIGSSKSLRYCWEAFSGMSANYTDCDTIRVSLLHSTYSPLQPRVLSYSITSTDCGVTEFSNSTGNVKSPRYPGPYLHNMHCVYTIEAGPNRTVSLQSLDLRIEGGGGSSLIHGHNGCPHDWLIIRCTGGGTERVSETGEPTPLFPDDYFESDEDVSYYDSLRLREMFYRDRMMSMSPFSSYLDRRLCGSDVISTTLMNCETITLEFHTDVSVAYQGFNIQYNRTISNTTTANDGRSDYICENQTFTDSVGIINSPNFTDRINCTYVIETGESNSVILEFLSVSSSAPSPSFRRHLGECQNTWLQISCFPGSMATRNPLQGRRICTAPDSGISMLSGCQRVSIQFYSTVAAAFSIRYTVTEGVCGNSNFTNSTGTITSPGYPLLYPDNLDCFYYVEVGANNWLSLRIRHFNLEGGTTHSYLGITLCNYDYLQMTCASGDPGARSAIGLLDMGMRICGLRMPFSASLAGCKRAAFRFVTDSSHERDGFKIQYRIIKDGEDECGNKNFSNSTGVISSPGFPSPYPDNVNCTYFIEIPGQRSFVLLDFQSFAVFMLGRYYPHDTCETSDSFRMRCVLGDAVDPSDSLNKKMCGPKAPFKVSVTGCQRLALDFYAHANVADGGTGFYINYTTFNPDDFCGRTLFNKPSGIIGLPDPSKKYITTFNCSYSVYVSNHSFVAFDIRSFTKTTDEKKSLSQDWLLIFCRGEKLNESHKITHKSGSQILRKFSNCSVVDIIFHNENEASERFFSISYFLGFHADVPKTASLSGSNRVGVGFGVFFVILIVVALVAVVVVWWRKHRPSLPWQKLEDDRPFVPDDDAEAEQSESGITTTEDGFSFSVHQPDKASCKKYISLNSLS